MRYIACNHGGFKISEDARIYVSSLDRGVCPEFQVWNLARNERRLLSSMFTVASRFRRLKFVGSYLSTIEAVGTGSWLSVVQVLLDVSIALLVAIIEFHGGIHRGYRTISSEFFFVKRYMQDHLDRVSSWRKNLRLHWDPPKFFSGRKIDNSY